MKKSQNGYLPLAVMAVASASALALAVYLTGAYLSVAGWRAASKMSVTTIASTVSESGRFVDGHYVIGAYEVPEGILSNYL